MRPLKIAFFQRDLPWEKYGGVANQVCLLARALSGHGHRVTVFSLSPPSDTAGFEVRQIAMPAWANNSRLMRKFGLGWYFRQQTVGAYDIVHCHGDNYLMAGRHPQVRTYYGSALGEMFWSRTARRALSQFAYWVFELLGGLWADARTAISPATARFVPGIQKVIPCGVDLGRFRPEPLKHPNPAVLFVGALHSRKRGDRMLDRFREIRRAVPEAELWMVSPETGPLQPGVRWFADIDESRLIALYQRAWAFCSLSRYEGFGVPLIEAMACGTPVAAVRNHGSEFILENGRYGLLLDDKSDMAPVTDLLRSAEKREHFIRSGRERVRSFDIQTIAREYEAVYADLLRKPFAA